MAVAISCRVCGKPLSGGLDTFGMFGEEVCRNHFFDYGGEPGDYPVVTRCNCLEEFMTNGDQWNCPAHELQDEDDYVTRAKLTIQCPLCTSYRVESSSIEGLS